MPELPEIETLKNCLETKLIGAVITKLYKKREDLRYPLSATLESETVRAKICNLKRRAKYLIIDLDNNHSIVIHLGMSGSFVLQPFDYPVEKHDHLVFYLNNSKKLVFNDPRRFGMIYCFRTNILEEKLFKNLGAEPLSDIMKADYLNSRFINRKVPIKSLLMDNHIIVGIGNIYASEILFLAKIHPARLGNTLSYNEVQKLVIEIKNVLTQAIQAGGTTIKDFVSGDNKPGYFQQKLLVYGRNNQKCARCVGVITKLTQSGRASFYCSSCQK